MTTNNECMVNYSIVQVREGMGSYTTEKTEIFLHRNVLYSYVSYIQISCTFVRNKIWIYTVATFPV